MEKESGTVNNEQLRPGRRRGFINRIALFCNHLAVAALLISYLSPYVSPANFWFLAFFGLAYPVLVFINLVFCFYWFFQLRPAGLYSLIAILCGIMFLHRFVQVDGSPAVPTNSKGIKVMSYNVKVFDLYNWSHNTETRSNMFALINDEQPAIACFQEFFHRDSSAFANVDSLQKINNWPGVHVKYTTTVKRIHHWGIATFSKFPVAGRGEVDFANSGNNVCIFTDLVVGSDTIRVYNMHLQSIGFSKADYKFVSDVQNDVETEEVENSKNILRRLKRAFVKRSNQADLVAASIAASPYPVIVCGDFNDTPSSYTYRAISANLEDSFIESGFGLGKSYAGAFPSFRIDYILHGPQLQSYYFRTIREELSDHFPIVTTLVPVK